MLPPGRRRPSLPTCLTLLLLLFTTTAHAAGSVLGIDFGTQYLKAALVKPGIPNEIVLTKDSKRKEVAAVAFKPSRDVPAELGTFPERQYGSDALALQGRMPGEVFPNLKPLLGITWSEDEGGEARRGSEALEAYGERYPAVRVERDEKIGAMVFSSAAFVDEEKAWRVEELLAMELANIRRNAEAMAGKGTTVEDAVITVPAFYTADERRAIVTAATLAGLDVSALVSDGLAVGVDYAKSRTFPEVTKGEKPEYHLVFDMGAGSTTATLLRFQSRSVKDVGRFNKTVQEVAVLGTGWDRTLGGDSLTNLILNDYIDKFLTKNTAASSKAIKANGRAMSRLWKEAESARQVLSANTEKSSSFEELLPDTDFKAKITRAEFEALASSFADRVAEPIRAALVAAKMDMQDVDSIILHGGAVRTPFVQKKLEEIAGGSAKLRSNVNADESAVFGAAFKGAGLSPSFKVKEIRDSDVAGYTAGMTYVDGGKERRQVLFGTTSPVGNGAVTKQVSFKDREDFEFGLYQVVGEGEREVVGVETLNLTAGVKTLKSQFGCETEDVSTKFSIRLSTTNGLPEVVSGSVSCEVEGAGKGESLGDSVKDWLGFGKKKEEQEPLLEDDGPTEEVETSTASSTSISDSATDPASASKIPEKPKKHTESIPISFITTPRGNPQPSAPELSRMRTRLASFDRSDRTRFAREEALNVLEAYTYHVRDVLDNADFGSVSTAEQRSAISSLLASTREWMESGKEVGKATKESLGEKLSALRELVEPVKARRAEEQARPEKVKALRESLEQTEKLVQMVAGQVKQAQEAREKAEQYDASVSASAAASSSTDAAVEPSASSADDLADLEEPDSPSPSDAAPEEDITPPKYHNAADFSPYTDVDLSELKDIQASVSAWLEEKEAAQSQLKPHEEPVLLVKDVEKKADELGVIMRDLLYKKMKKPSSASKAKTTKKTSSKTKSAKKSKKTDEEDVKQPKFMTVNSDDEMPTEEEILEMVSSAKGSGKSSSSVRDEL